MLLLICQFFPALSVESTQSQSKSQVNFVDIGKVILKFIWRGKRPRITNRIPNNVVGGLTLPDIKELV